MLFIVFPLANILGSVGMGVCSISVGFVIQPVAFVNVTIGVIEFTVAVCFAIAPLSLVPRAIKPLLLSLAVSLPVVPFAFIDGATFECNWSFEFSRALTKVFLFGRIGRILHPGFLLVLILQLSSLRDALIHVLVSKLLLLSIDLDCFLHLVLVNTSDSTILWISLTIGEKARAIPHYQI